MGVVASDERLSGYPLTLSFDSDAETLSVVGLVPDAETRSDLSRSLAATLPAVPVELHVNTLPVPDTGAARIERRLDAFDAALGRRDGDVEDIERAVADLRAERTSRDADVAALSERLTGLAAHLDDPIRRLREWTAANAVFFSNGTAFRDPEAAARTLDALAGLMRDVATGTRLRVVGYADELGGVRGTVTVSVARAETVVEALAACGVAPERLVAVGRAAEQALHDETGPASPNRRVEFEPVFANE